MFNLFSLINTWASLAKVANSTGLTDKVVNTPIVKQAVEKVSPVVSPIVKPISDAVQWANTFYQDNVVKPIVRDQKWKQEREKIVAPYRDVFSQYSMDDLKDFELTPEETDMVVSTLSQHGLKVQWMDEYINQKEQARAEADRVRAMQEQNTNWLLPWVDPNFQFHETIPWSDWIKENMTWKSDPTDGASASLGKAVVNLPWNALRAWIWLFNLGSTAVQEWVYDTLAWGIVNPAVKAWGQFIDETAKDYSQNGVLDGTFNLANKAKKFAVENPLDTAMILRPKATGEMIGKAGKTILKPVSENIVKPITTPIVNAGKGIVKKVTPDATNLSTKWNRFNAKDIEDFTKTTWETPGQWATSRGLTDVWEKALDTAVKNYGDSLKAVDNAMGTIDWNFKVQWWKDYLWMMLDDLGTRLKNTESSELGKYTSLESKYYKEWLSMSEINDVKRAYARNFKYTYEQSSTEPAMRSTNLQKWLREWQMKTAQDSGFSNLAEVNKATQWWKMYSDMLEKKLSRSSGNNAVSLTDFVALSGWTQANLSLFLLKRVWASDKVRWKIIKTLAKPNKSPIVQPTSDTILRSNVAKKYGLDDSNILNNRSVSGVQRVTPRPLLPAPSGKPTSAKEVNVKPIIVPPQWYKGDITSRSIVKDPRTIIKSPEGVKRTIVKPKEILRPVNGTPPLWKEAKTIVKPPEKRTIIKPPEKKKTIVKQDIQKQYSVDDLKLNSYWNIDVRDWVPEWYEMWTWPSQFIKDVKSVQWLVWFSEYSKWDWKRAWIYWKEKSWYNPDLYPIISKNDYNKVIASKEYKEYNKKIKEDKIRRESEIVQQKLDNKKKKEEQLILMKKKIEEEILPDVEKESVKRIENEIAKIQDNNGRKYKFIYRWEKYETRQEAERIATRNAWLHYKINELKKSLEKINEWDYPEYSVRNEYFKNERIFHDIDLPKD